MREYGYSPEKGTEEGEGIFKKLTPLASKETLAIIGAVAALAGGASKAEAHEFSPDVSALEQQIIQDFGEGALNRDDDGRTIMRNEKETVIRTVDPKTGKEYVVVINKDKAGKNLNGKYGAAKFAKAKDGSRIPVPLEVLEAGKDMQTQVEAEASALAFLKAQNEGKTAEASYLERNLKSDLDTFKRDNPDAPKWMTDTLASLE